jgi:hypothetical protein
MSFFFKTLKYAEPDAKDYIPGAEILQAEEQKKEG